MWSVLLVVVLVAAPVQAVEAEGRVVSAGGPDAVAGRFIVVLKDLPGARSADVRARQLVERYGGHAGHVYQDVFDGFSVSARSDQARRIAADPEVAYVEADKITAIADVQANPPSWGTDRVDQRALPLNNAYQHDAGGRGVPVYVIDTGIRQTHSDFGGRAGFGFDATGGRGEDCHGHGTHVAGTIGGQAHGVAKTATLIAVRVAGCTGNGTVSDLLAGLNWVAGVRARPAVVNISFGTSSATQIVDDSVTRLVSLGFTVVVAAGNGNADACTSTPARAWGVITVGATGRDDQRAGFSNRGSCLSLFAPGVNIVSAYHRNDNDTATLSGTSMAAPHVAGIAARYLTLSPLATPRQVRDTLNAAATTNQVRDPGAGSPNRLLYADLPVLSNHGKSALGRIPGHLETFAVGADKHIWTRWWNQSAWWSARERLGDLPAAGPTTAVTAVARKHDQIDVFATDAEGRVLTNWWNPAEGWHSWFRINDQVVTLPGATVSAVARSTDLMDLFVTDTAGRIMSVRWDGPIRGWQNWYPVTEAPVAVPGATVSVVARKPELMDVFTTNAAGHVLTNWWNTVEGWHGWAEVTEDPIAAPGATVAALARNPDRMDLFVVGTDGRIRTAWWGHPFNRWQGGNTISDGGAAPGATVSVVALNPVQTDLFTVSPTGTVLWTRRNPDETWRPWSPIPNSTAAPKSVVTAVARYANEMDLFTLDHGGGARWTPWQNGWGTSSDL